MSKPSVFFSSDHHFFHANIIKYANRPFADIEEMNFELISRHNKAVSNNDAIYFIGDFCFSTNISVITNIIRQLNGEKHFICGNHDGIMQHGEIKRLFKTFSTSPHKEINIQDELEPSGKKSITLCHYAMRVWNKSHYGAYHLYGHSHGNLPDDPNSLSLDIGVDCFNYAPISYTQIKQLMKAKTWTPHIREKDTHSHKAIPV